jgi:hypothetical protein
MTLVAGACACVLGAAATPALATLPTYYGSFYSSADEVFVSASDYGSYGSGDTFVVQLVRNGTVVADNAGPFPQIQLPAGSLQANDQAVLLRNNVQVASFTYDGTPTINADACTGASQFTGSAGPGDLWASAYTPANGSGTHHNVTLTRTPAGFAAAVDSPLLAGDRLSVDLSSHSSTSSAEFYLNSYTQMAVKDCPAAQVTPDPVPPVTPPGPLGPTTTQLLAGVTTSLSKETKLVSSLGIEKVVSSGGVNVPFVFLSPGTIGYVWLANAPAHAATAAKTVTVAKGSLTRSAPGSAKVKVRLTKAGKKLLRRSRSLKLTIRGTFTPVGGKPQVATKKVTVKRHAKKKHG